MAATLTQETAAGAVPTHVAYLEYPEVAWPLTVSRVSLRSFWQGKLTLK